MLRFGASQSGRAEVCWGLDFSDGPLLGYIGNLYDSDADALIFPQRFIDLADQTAHAIVLDHCVKALAATVSRQWEAAKTEALQVQIAQRLTALPLDRALALGSSIQNDWYARPPLPPMWFRVLPDRWHPDRGYSDEIDTIEAIEILDRLVDTLQKREAVLFDEVGLTSIAFYAGLNPTALCAEAFSQGELFAVSAWLGMVCRGRSVVMPRFVAAYWTSVFQGAKEPGRLPWAPDMFLLERAASAIGLDQLEKASAQVLVTGPIRLARRSRIISRGSLPASKFTKAKSLAT